MTDKTNNLPASNFRNWLWNNTAAKNFSIIAFILCVAYYVLETVNNRAQMADFRVYYDAANAFLHNTQLYGKAFGVSSGFYKYSPVATLPFIPLAVLPYTFASIVYYLIITVSIIWFSLRLYYYFTSETPQAGASKSSFIIIMSLTLIFMADHLERELHLGNINLFLLIGAFIIFLKAKEKKSTQAGFLMGALLLFKPHFLILIPYFVWKKEWRILFFSCASIVIGLILPALLKGFDGNLQLLHQWLLAMQDHNVHLYDSPNTIYGIVNHFLFNYSAHSWLVYFFLALTALTFMALMIRNQRLMKTSSIQFIEYFLLIALIPNLAHTDTEHFMWTWPLIAFVIISLVNNQTKNQRIFIGLLVLAFIPYCLNSPDIVGRDMRFLLDEGGLLGVANLLIVLVAVLVSFYRQPNQTANA